MSRNTGQVVFFSFPTMACGHMIGSWDDFTASREFLELIKWLFRSDLEYPSFVAPAEWLHQVFSCISITQ